MTDSDIHQQKDFPSLENTFLVAMPQMEDPTFKKTVILICRHSPDGAIGITINRESNINFNEICQQLDIQHNTQNSKQVAVLNGGPVQPEVGIVIHKKMHQKWQSSITLSEQLSLTSSLDILSHLAQNQSSEEAFMCLGYAGWEAGQLEMELKTNVWFTTPVDEEILFSRILNTKWHRAANILGINISQLSQQTGHA